MARNIIKIARATEAELSLVKGLLHDYEAVFATDTNKFGIIKPGTENSIIYMLPAIGGVLGSDLSAGNFKITNLAAPTANQDAVTKLYVDTAVGAITGSTNLGITKTGTTNTITSSTGTSAVIAGATTTQAGLVTTGAQTWNGTKTFSLSPIVPTPTDSNHAANMDYVQSYADDAIDVTIADLAPLLIFRHSAQAAAVGSGGLLSDLDAGGFTLTGVRTPTAGGDATNKTYVDTALANAIANIEAEVSGVYRPSGNWNAATNTPAITNPMTEDDVGKVFYVETAAEEGTERFGFLWHQGDKLAIIEGGVITKWDNVDDVTSVNGQTGTVVLTAVDISGEFTVGQIPNLPISKISGLQAALDGKAASNHTHSAATTSAAGFMSAADKTKLNGIATGATANLGTVTNVSAGTQINGMSMTIATGTTTPTIATAITNAANFRTAIGAGTSSFSGNYNDLTNTPTIPAAQVNVNWNSTSGITQILNKPSWATETQAKAGTSTTVFMSPARTFDAISVAIIDGGDLSELL